MFLQTTDMLQMYVFLFCFMLSQCHAYGLVMVTWVRVSKIAHVHVCPQRH